MQYFIQVIFNILTLLLYSQEKKSVLNLQSLKHFSTLLFAKVGFPVQIHFKISLKPPYSFTVIQDPEKVRC